MFYEEKCDNTYLNYEVVVERNGKQVQVCYSQLREQENLF